MEPSPFESNPTSGDRRASRNEMAEAEMCFQRFPKDFVGEFAQIARASYDFKDQLVPPEDEKLHCLSQI